MFYLLRQFAREQGEKLRYFIGESFPNNEIRGLHVGVDPLWLTWIRRRYVRRWFLRGEYFDEFIYDFDQMSIFQEKPPEWALHCAARGMPPNASPLGIKVILRKKEILAEGLNRFPRAFQVGSDLFPISYEARPPTFGLAKPGDGVGNLAGTYEGTLGGFLVDAVSREAHLVTCAHVVGTEQTVHYRRTAADRPILANMVHAVLPPVNTEAGCNRCSHMPPPALDLAIAKIIPGHSTDFSIPNIGRPHTVTSIKSMGSYNRVAFYGHTSHHVKAELGEVCIYHEIEIGRQPHCFGDIFSITPPHPWYLNSELVRRGDSGAWITRSIGNFVSWDGMLIAGDGAHGYACFAENILRGCMDSGFNLVLP